MNGCYDALHARVCICHPGGGMDRLVYAVFSDQAQCTSTVEAEPKRPLGNRIPDDRLFAAVARPFLEQVAGALGSRAFSSVLCACLSALLEWSTNIGTTVAYRCRLERRP